jgi:hypothetical protein
VPNPVIPALTGHLGAGHLVVHPLFDRPEALAQGGHLGDDLAGLAVDLRHPADAAAHLLAELVRRQDAGRRRALHQPHHVLDVQGRHRRLVGQAADLAGHHQEAPAVLAGLLRLAGGVGRQQVRLVGRLGGGGGGDHLSDAVGLLAGDRQLGGDRADRLGQLLHGPLRAPQPLAAGAGQVGWAALQ